MSFHALHLLIGYFDRIKPLIVLLTLWGCLKRENR